MSHKIDQLLNQQLNLLKSEGRYRFFADLQRIPGQFPKALYRPNDGQTPYQVTVWCSNDYLGMGQHPKVIQAMHTAIDQFGAGAGGTRNISGTHHLMVQLEQELASLHNKEAALVFSSGYVSNEASLAALAKVTEDCAVFSDRLNHASMIAGIRNSRAEKFIFNHNDSAHLKDLLGKISHNRLKIIAIESVYSMEGDIAPLAEFCQIARENDALLYVDEVHAVGLYGKHGGGISERDLLTDSCTVIQGTLAKAFGLMGGYIAGSKVLVDYVRSFAAGFIFTTALPPVIAAGALASIQHLRQDQSLRDQHQLKVRFLKNSLKAAGIPMLPSQSHIVPVLVGDAVQCLALSRLLLQNHAIYVQPINYPTVPKGSERLRLTPSPFHQENDINFLVEALKGEWKKLGLKGAE